MEQKNKPSPLSPLISFVARFNLIFFLVIIVCGLSVAVLTIANIVQYTYDEKNYSSVGNDITFDETTIEKASQLHGSSDNPNSSQSISGRTDLFSE